MHGFVQIDKNDKKLLHSLRPMCQTGGPRAKCGPPPLSCVARQT